MWRGARDGGVEEGGMSLGWTYSSSGSDAGKRKKLFQLPAPRRRRQRESALASERETAKERALCECVFVCGTYSGLVGELLFVCVCASLPGTLLPPSCLTPTARARGGARGH